MDLDRIQGTGLGLRQEHLSALVAAVPNPIAFLEVAPENWMCVGGGRGHEFRRLTERHPFVAHGLSLSLGGPDPLDGSFLDRLRRFLDGHGVALYTEHLSWCAADGHLYELLPLPFTAEAVRHVAARIRTTQEVLGRRIAVENPTYYLIPPGAEMDETTFIAAVVEEADCWLHLDVNNVYVNSINHGFDPVAFLHRLPAERIVYLHVAGHHPDPALGLLIDTHGMPICPSVWSLLELAYGLFGPLPTALERDFHLPPLPALLPELARIARLQGQGRTHRPRRPSPQIGGRAGQARDAARP
jgi:hypothetical protein